MWGPTKWLDVCFSQGFKYEHTHTHTSLHSKWANRVLFSCSLGALSINSLIFPLSPHCSIHSCAVSSHPFSPPFLCFFSSIRLSLLSSTIVRIFMLGLELLRIFYVWLHILYAVCNWRLLFLFPLQNPAIDHWPFPVEELSFRRGL